MMANTLEQSLSTVFGQVGQDASDPAVQSQVAKVAANLRASNPDASDEDLITNLKANLPALINTVTAKPQGRPVDPNQLQDLAQQQSKQLASDAQQAQFNRSVTPIRNIVPRSVTGNTDIA